MMVPLIRRIRRVSLPNLSVCNLERPTSNAAATAAHAPRSCAPKTPRRAPTFFDLVLVRSKFTQQHHAAGYSTVSFTEDGYFNSRPFQLHEHQHRREIGSRAERTSNNEKDGLPAGVRISTLLSKHLGLSRRQSERMVLTERVTLFGKIVKSPTFELRPSKDPNQNSTTAMKVDGKLIKDVENTLELLYAEQQMNESVSAFTSVDDKRVKHNERKKYSNTRVWLANKLKGELITEDDPVGRPSMLQRLIRGGVGKSNKKNNAPLHLKPVGRLDMMTEGLMILTNDGNYARQLELPDNKLWRTYRVRVHGRLTMGKLRAMRKGLTVRMNDNMMAGEDTKASGEVVQTSRLMKYKGMKVHIERKNLSRDRGRSGGTNTWLRITCTEGKNRQLRRILESLGLNVTRLIRIGYGDYDLNTIPPGLAIEVPVKGLYSIRRKGSLFARGIENEKEEFKGETAAVQWVNY